MAALQHDTRSRGLYSTTRMEGGEEGSECVGRWDCQSTVRMEAGKGREWVPWKWSQGLNILFLFSLTSPRLLVCTSSTPLSHLLGSFLPLPPPSSCRLSPTSRLRTLSSFSFHPLSSFASLLPSPNIPHLTLFSLTSRHDFCSLFGFLSDHSTWDKELREARALLRGAGSEWGPPQKGGLRGAGEGPGGACCSCPGPVRGTTTQKERRGEERRVHGDG